MTSFVSIVSRCAIAAATVLAAAPRADEPAPLATVPLETRLSDRLAALVAGGKAPGVTAAVAFADGRRIGLAWGTTERGGGRALRADDRMLGGSTGKTFVAALALQLEAEGLISLDELLSRRFGGQVWYDALPGATALTPRLLLRHRAGLKRYEFDPRFLQQLVADPDRDFTPYDELGFLAGTVAPFAPGDGFLYSDTNYVLLGLLLERAGEASLDAQIERRFLEPLGLKRTSPSDRRELPGLVQGHAGANNGFLPQDLMLEDGKLVVNPGFEGAGGGYVTTSGDLAAWALALWGGEVVVSGPQRAAMLDAAPAPELGPDVRYGCGVMVRESALGPSLGHAGFFPGWLTEVRCWPEKGLAVALQANSSERGALPRAPGAVLTALAEEALAPDDG
jgi:D-alanyl-D-alanine carboxypeptidase